MSIGERIIELRKEANLSQGQIAASLAVSRQAVSKWETDQAVPDVLNMIRLAELLDTDIEYLSTGRRNFSRRPPVVLSDVKVVEKVIEKPVIQVETIETVVEKPVVQYVEKPVIKKVYRTRYLRNPMEFLIVGGLCFIGGILVGLLL